MRFKFLSVRRLELTHSTNFFLTAREYATTAIKDQKEAFKTWGIMADWDQQCYYTYSNDYVKNQLRQFYNLYEKVTDSVTRNQLTNI